MKQKIILSLFILFALHTKGDCYNTRDIIIGKINDSLTWIESFREFRAAVYTNDKVTMKSFIDFPILNEANEIWSLVYQGNQKALNSIPDKIKPFKEKDFDTHSNKLFTKSFTSALQKIKTEELYKKGETETAALKEGNTTYKIYGSYDKENKTISLNLAFNTIIKDKNGEVMDGGEFNVIYLFDVLKNGQIRFRKIRIAG